MQKRAKAKGQAAVELAVLMVAMVPVFLYVLFSDELNRHKLDLQEAVVSSPWDYAFLNYESSVPSGALNAQHRNEYINHSSANPGSKGRNNAADSLFAGPRWMKEVSCQLSKSDDLTPGSGMVADFKSKFQQGGKVTCSAQKGVVNFFLITQFMHSWSKVDLSTKKTASRSTQAPDSASTWPLAEQNFTLVTDTWALTSVQTVKPDDIPFTARAGCSAGGALSSFLGGGDPFYNRMFAIFCKGDKRSDAVKEANKIVEEASKKKYLAEHVKEDPLIPVMRSGDNTGTPTLAFSSPGNGTAGENLGFNSSPWKGGGGDKHYQAHSQRKNTYLGEELK